MLELPAWFPLVAVGAISAAVAYNVGKKRTRVGRATAVGIGVPALLYAVGSAVFRGLRG